MAQTRVERLKVNRFDLGNQTHTYVYTVPGRKPFTKERHDQSRIDFDSMCGNAAVQIRHHSQGAVGADAADYSLSQLGEMISERYVPDEVSDFLFGSNEPLEIETNDPEFPWELMRYHNQVLGKRRPLGRIVAVNQQGEIAASRRGATPRALLVANPTGDLPHTEVGVQALERLLRAQQPAYDVRATADPGEGYCPRAHLATQPPT